MLAEIFARIAAEIHVAKFRAARSLPPAMIPWTDR